jgi:hypothetical protein
MDIFTKHKIEWLIGITCAFLPGILGWFINKTSNIPDIVIPFWLLCILFSIPLAWLVVKIYQQKEKSVPNKSFGVEREFIDGKHYTNCKFDGTELIFKGEKNFRLSHNKFKSPPRITFSGYASNTINQMIAMYSDPSFRPIIEQTFDNIRAKGAELEKKN